MKEMEPISSSNHANAKLNFLSSLCVLRQYISKYVRALLA